MLQHLFDLYSNCYIPFVIYILNLRHTDIIMVIFYKQYNLHVNHKALPRVVQIIINKILHVRYVYEEYKEFC